MRPFVLPATLLVLVTAVACKKEQRGDEALTSQTSAVGSVGGGVTVMDGAMPAPPPTANPAPMRARREAARKDASERAAAGDVNAALALSAEASPVATAPADAPAMQGVPRTTDPQGATASGELLGRSMIIRTGNATLEVTALDSAIARARLLALRLGGFVGNASMQGGKDQPRMATLELKLPAQRFDEAVSGLSPIGKVENVNVAAEDVGEEFVDVSARVANGRRLEEQLVRLLAQRTGRLSDALEVERELARVREEIERYEGRMRYLRSRVSVSTLSLTLHEPLPLMAQHPGDTPIRDAFAAAWRNLVAFVAALIASLGILIPLGVLGALAWALWRRFGPVFPARPVTRVEEKPAA